MLSFNFEVHTPFRLFYSGKAQAISLMLVDGEIGVYANHSPFTAVSVTGILKIKEDDEKWHSAFISAGILEVKEEKNVLMVDSAEWANEIDKERVLESKRQAEKILQENNFKFEVEKATAKLKRAEFRLKLLGE